MAAMAPRKHPLDPLASSEVSQVSSLLKSRFPEHDLHFKHIAILEPPKKQLRAFLRAERHGHPAVSIPARRASALYYHRRTPNLFLAVVKLDVNQVEKIEKVGYQFHAQADIDEIIQMRDVCLAHPKVLEAIERYKLPEGFKVVCDTWPYGRDSADEESRLLQVTHGSKFIGSGLELNMSSATSSQREPLIQAPITTMIRSPSHLCST